ncbi:unnamed protein product [Amoebophrya sp. A120]|nr:unnamed protein product [Amoebophrya sp. A120]|eukprot:GSA120T00023731001.1
MLGDVFLHIYHVTNRKEVKQFNDLIGKLTTDTIGAYHIGVEVYGREWAYGGNADVDPTQTGVFECAPGQCDNHEYRERYQMPQSTAFSSDQVMQLLRDTLMPEWLGKDYDLLRKNCCTFANAFCVALGVGEIPASYNKLARFGAKVESTGRKMKEGAEKAGQVVKTKAQEFDETFRISEKVLDPVGEKVKAGADSVKQKMKEIDENYEVKERVSQAGAKVQEGIATGWTRLSERAAHLQEEHQVKERVSEAMTQAKSQVKDVGKRLSSFFRK